MNYQQLQKIEENGISVLDYIVLLNVYYRSEAEFLRNEEYQHMFRVLQLQGYLSNNNKLTLEGKNLIEFEVGIPKYESKVDSDYFVELHKKLQTRLFELTGKKQNMLQGKYAFLCNAKDLQNKLTKVITKYDLKDLNRIEKILLNYVNKCVKARFDKVQLIEYFIMKDNISALATAYDNYEDTEVDNKIETTESGVHLI